MVVSQRSSAFIGDYRSGSKIKAKKSAMPDLQQSFEITLFHRMRPGHVICVGCAKETIERQAKKSGWRTRLLVLSAIFFLLFAILAISADKSFLIKDKIGSRLVLK